MAQRKQKDTKKIKSEIDFSEKKYIAIDPGKSGGIAVLKDNEVQAYKCPPTFKEMAQLIKSIKKDTYLCILEKVHAFPTDGRSSAFKFGTNYGAWIGILESNKENKIKKFKMEVMIMIWRFNSIGGQRIGIRIKVKDQGGQRIGIRIKVKD